jgi:hypothetical protein
MIGFADESGGLQSVLGALTAHVAVGDAPEVFVEDGDETV